MIVYCMLLWVFYLFCSWTLHFSAQCCSELLFDNEHSKISDSFGTVCLIEYSYCESRNSYRLSIEMAKYIQSKNVRHLWCRVVWLEFHKDRKTADLSWWGPQANLPLHQSCSRYCTVQKLDQRKNVIVRKYSGRNRWNMRWICFPACCLLWAEFRWWLSRWT